MLCSQVAELLSEYVDDALDPGARAGVEEHLAQCRNCAAELASLRTYLEAMDSLPQFQAPPSFLAGVHERLEQPGWISRLLSWLFFPMKIKLPFEAAGLVAASLLVVLLYRGLEPQKAQVVTSPPAPAREAPAVASAPVPAQAGPRTPLPSAEARSSIEDSREGSSLPATSRLAVEEAGRDKTPSAAAGSSFPAATGVPVEQPVQSAPTPLQERATPPQAPPLTPQDQAPVLLQERAKSPAREPLPAKPQPSLSAAVPKTIELVLHLTPPTDQPASPSRVAREQSLPGTSSATAAPQAQEQAIDRKVSPAPARAPEMPEQERQASPTTPLSQLKELVAQARGEILSLDNEKGTTACQVATVQLPARNYRTFVQTLRRLGRLEDPAVTPQSADQDALIRVHIRLIPPS